MIIRLLEERDFEALKEIDKEADEEYHEYLKREHPQRYSRAIENYREIKTPPRLDYYIKTSFSHGL